MKKTILLLSAIMLLFAGCKKDLILEEGQELYAHEGELMNPALVETTDVSNVTYCTAQCGYSVTSSGDGEIMAHGICWKTSQNPTVNDNKTNGGTGTGSFTSNISNLAPNTQYYARAYVTYKVADVTLTSYGKEKSFKTKELTMPAVTTNNVTDIATNSAKCGGNVTSDGNGTVTARGVCWNTSPNPTISNSHTTDGTGTGSFTSNIPNLAPNTQYYVRAYATNEKGTSYGEEKSFTTLATTGSINGYDWVDLGLPSGLKWATCNVGATSPEDYGDYFAWGETGTKEEYTEENSVTYLLSISQLQSQGYIDGEGNLTSSHDAATANWGGSWRMPTKAEIQELLDECTWQWTTQGGKNGYKVTGPNGNSIFLPAAGRRYGSSLYGAGEGGFYWSSTPLESSTNGAYYLYFYGGNHYVGWYYRDYGQSVRPVAE